MLILAALSILKVLLCMDKFTYVSPFKARVMLLRCFSLDCVVKLCVFAVMKNGMEKKN